MASSFRAFLNSPVGPKTTHFLGSCCKLGICHCWVGGHAETRRYDFCQHDSMCIYSALFMRFAWMVQPLNYLLLGCHASNETVQLYQLSRWAESQGYLQQKEGKIPSQ